MTKRKRGKKVCSDCAQVFGSAAALRAHRKQEHGAANVVAPAPGDVISFNVSIPMMPAGIHPIDCPVCHSPTEIKVLEDGKTMVGRSTEKPPSSLDHENKSKYNHVVREHPMIIRERMKQRKGKKTVVMMGTHGRSGPLAPWSETGIDEWWGLNDSVAIFGDQIDKFNRWFQLHHRWRFTRRGTRYAADHWQWLQDTEVPQIYMQRHYADVPNSIKFPLREVSEMMIGDKLPRGAGHVLNYYASTFSYMLGLVLLEKKTGVNDWERIEIYGCELEQLETEYFRQRPGMEWWLGMCAEAGIEVYFPHETFIAYAQDLDPSVGRMLNYPGYMTYGYASPNMEEAKARNEPLGEDPIEENLVGTWEDLPYMDFLRAANKGVYEITRRTNWVEDIEKINQQLNEWVEENGYEL